MLDLGAGCAMNRTLIRCDPWPFVPIISKAHEQKLVNTESGHSFKLLVGRGQITLSCTDGNLRMPDYILKVVD